MVHQVAAGVMVMPGIVFVLGAMATFVWFCRRAGDSEPPPLSDAEERALGALLDDDGRG